MGLGWSYSLACVFSLFPLSFFFDDNNQNGNRRKTPPFADPSRTRRPLISLIPTRTDATTRTDPERTDPFSESANSIASLIVTMTRTFATTANPAETTTTGTTTSTSTSSSTTVSFAIPRPGEDAHPARPGATASRKNDASLKRSTTHAKSGSK